MGKIDKDTIVFSVLSDPKDPNQYIGKLDDGYIRVYEGYEPYSATLERSVNYDIVEDKTPWGEVPKTESGDPVYGLKNLHALLKPFSLEECEKKRN